MSTNAIPLSNPPAVQPAEQQSRESAVIDCPDGETTAAPGKDSAGGPA
jgi:hypothetical protein